MRLCIGPECFWTDTNPLEVLTEVFARYRCRSKTILYLVELCDDVRLRTNRSFAVPILLAVLTYLSFAATGAIQLIVGDTLALSQPTITRLCKQVGEVISGLAGGLFNFPRVKRQPSWSRTSGIYQIGVILVVVSAFLKLSRTLQFIFQISTVESDR